MRSLYYLLDTLDAVTAVASTLRQQRIDDDAFYIVSRDQDGVRRRHLHDASVLTRTDFVHSGERGALIGGLGGLLFALWMAMVQPMGLQMSLLSFLLVSALIGCFGAWVGGMVGISHEHYKLTPFHEAIAQGKYLLVIELREAAAARAMKQLLHRLHPEAVFEAEDAVGVDVTASSPAFRPRHL